MHLFAHHHHAESSKAGPETQGRVLNQGAFYDWMLWFLDTFLLGGKLRAMRQRIVTLAGIGPGSRVLDVGCGTGTLALEIASRAGATGRVSGIDPGSAQIARARSKAARRNLPVDFDQGVIEHLAYPDTTFDAVVSSLMMHHLPDDLKRQGLIEIARVLKPGGRLVIADFKRPEGRADGPAHLGVGEQGAQDLPALVQGAGFGDVQTEALPLPRIGGLPDVGLVKAMKR